MDDFVSDYGSMIVLTIAVDFGIKLMFYACSVTLNLVG